MAKIKQKSFGILITSAVCGLVFFVVYFAAHFAVKEIKPQWFTSQAIKEAGRLFSVKMERDMKLAQSSATSENPATLILYNKHHKVIADTLNAASTKEQKLNIAANVFFGSYFMNTRTRPRYCALLGVPIKSFVNSYKQKHYQLFVAAENILQYHTENGNKYDIDKSHKAMSSSDEKIIAQDMKDAASIIKMSEQELCHSFEQDSIKWVNMIDFRKSSPETAKVILSMGEVT